MKLDSSQRRLSYLSQTVYTDLVLKVSLAANLSDKKTQAITTFTVTFKMFESSFEPDNRAPIFAVEPLQEYLRQKEVNEDSNDLTTSILPIPLPYADLEFDNVTVDLQCLTCFDLKNYFSFDYSKEIMIIAPETPTGQYKIQITLTDDNLEN